MEEAFRKTMRKIYLALGIVMVLNSVFSLLMTQLYTTQLTEATDTAAATVEYVPKVADMGFWSFLTPTVLLTLTYVCMGLIVALIVLMVIKAAQVYRSDGAAVIGRTAGQAGGARFAGRRI